MSNQNEINQLKEKIYELQEYLNSDSCKGCYESVLKLEDYQKKLTEIINESI